MLDSQINDPNRFRNMVVQMEKCRAAKHTSNMICYSADVAVWFNATDNRVKGLQSAVAFLGLTIVEWNDAGRC
jgi:hypothetical protein